MFFERPESLPAFAVFHLIIHIVAYYRAARPLVWGSDDYCEAHSYSRLRRDELMSRQANKFHKSFQIFQIFFHLYLFVRFVPICKISVPRDTLSFSRLRRDELMSRQANKFSKSFQILQIFFYHYLFVRFVQICKISVPGGTLSFSRLRRVNLPNPPFYISLILSISPVTSLR